MVCVYLYAGPYDATTQNVVSPGLRASAMTLTLLVTSAPLLLLAAALAATGLPSIGRDTAAMEQDGRSSPSKGLLETYRANKVEGGWPPT